MQFHWHKSPLDRDTPVTEAYASTQNMRRFMRDQCSDAFKFDRAFMAWIDDGTPKMLGDVADEWTHRQKPR